MRVDDEEPQREWDSWDLTRPPTRAEAGIAEDRTTVIYQDSPDGVRAVTVTLPEERVLRTQANSVAFSSVGTPSATRSDPTTMDIGGAQLPLDEALDELAASLRELDIRSSAADDWYREAAGADGSERVESPWLRAEVGYLTVEVQGRYNPLSDDAVVAYVLSW